MSATQDKQPDKDVYSLGTIYSQIQRLNELITMNYKLIKQIGGLHNETNTEDESREYVEKICIMSQIDRAIQEARDGLNLNNERLAKLTTWLKE